jgi:hypothetical protein
MYCIVYKWHYNNGSGFMRNIPDDEAPAKVVEQMQRIMASDGHPTGITWQTCENDLVKAMIASTKL